jgi:hypothetical protein
LLIQSLCEKDAAFLVQVCEAYGRFILHRNAFCCETLELNGAIRHLLQWTNANVMWALTRKKPDASVDTNISFNDPNLSSIQVEKSFDMHNRTPEIERPRRRANLNQTPERLDVGLGLFDDSPSEAVETPRFTLTRSLATALMKSSCILFAEWIAVGGLGSGFISEAATGWCQVLDSVDDREQLKIDILPVFLRLTIQLAKKGEYDLLKELLIKIPDRVGEDEICASAIGKAFSHLLSTSGAHSKIILEHSIASVLYAAETLLQTATDELQYDIPESLQSLWPDKTGCITTALKVSVSNRASSLELSRQLSLNFLSWTASSPRMALFAVRCLALVCNSESGSKIVKEASTALRGLERHGATVELCALLDEAIESL